MCSVEATSVVIGLPVALAKVMQEKHQYVDYRFKKEHNKITFSGNLDVSLALQLDAIKT